MFYYRHITIILIMILSITNAFSQDEILFLNGKILKGKVLDKTKYEFTFKDDSNKEFVIDKYRVFSVTQNNKEDIVYEYDTLSGNFLKVKDMQMFVYGERDAHYSYKPHTANYLALAVGAATGFMMQRDQSFVYIPAPLVYTTITLLFPTKVNQKRLKDTKYLKEDEYLRGYERIARSKRTQGVLRNSVIGMAAGFLIGLAVNSNGDDK